MTQQQPEMTTIQPDEPGLAVQLKATAPSPGTYRNGSSRPGEWTLDLLERTCMEFRAAGGWDQSRIKIDGYPPAVKCEVLAVRGADAMPWGWRPSQGAPPPPQYAPLPDPVVPDATPGTQVPRAAALLGNRVLHGALLVALLVLAVLR